LPRESASKVSLGYVHHLSKRTALYATVARVSNRNGAALTVGGPAFISTSVFAPRTSSGYDFGIRHAF
jgi:predicted porin